MKAADLLCDLCLILGAAAIAAGAWFFHPGAGLIVGGLLLAAAAIAWAGLKQG